MKRYFISFAAAAILLGLISANASPALAQTKIKLTQPVDSLTFFPIYVGRELGYFRMRGSISRLLPRQEEDLICKR